MSVSDQFVSLLLKIAFFLIDVDLDSFQCRLKDFYDSVDLLFLYH